MENKIKGIKLKAHLMIVGILGFIIAIFVIVRILINVFGYQSLTSHGELDVKNSDKYIYYGSEIRSGYPEKIDQVGKLYTLNGDFVRNTFRKYTFKTDPFTLDASEKYFFVEDEKIYHNSGDGEKELVMDDEFKKFVIKNGFQISESGKYFFTNSIISKSPYGLDEIYVYNVETGAVISDIRSRLMSEFDFDAKTVSISAFWQEEKGSQKLEIEGYSSLESFASNQPTASFTYNAETDELKKEYVKSPEESEEIGSTEIPEDFYPPTNVFEMFLREIKYRMSSSLPASTSGLFGDLLNEPFTYFSRDCYELISCAPDFYEGDIKRDTYIKVENPIIGKKSLVFVDKKNDTKKELMSWFSVRNQDAVNIMRISESDLALVKINERVFLLDTQSGNYKHLFDVRIIDEQNPFKFEGNELTIFVN